jgi:polysaccharide export outer membrane protein
MWGVQSHADDSLDLRLGAGDSIHISVFRNVDLGLDTRVSERGTISYPLIGTIQVGGLTTSEAEARIAKGLKDGGFVQEPQVNVVLVTVRANLVSVLGQVGKPGLYPLDPTNLHLSEVLAIAGGVGPTGGDRVILKGMRNGQAFRKEIDIASIFIDGKIEDDIIVNGRDEIYVPLAPLFYIYGEVQKPGSGIILRDMTVIQALAQGGGLTPRGTERNIQLHRRNAKGEMEKLNPAMTDRVLPNDVLYVHESLF